MQGRRSVACGLFLLLTNKVTVFGFDMNIEISCLFTFLVQIHSLLDYPGNFMVLSTHFEQG